MVGAVTVRLVVCETPAKLAETFVVPGLRELASPVGLIVATATADELQATAAVRSALLPSLYTPVAVNC